MLPVRRTSAAAPVPDLGRAGRTAVGGVGTDAGGGGSAVTASLSAEGERARPAAYGHGLQVSARADYAVRACVVLATSRGLVKSDTVAQRQQIPAHYLRTVLGALCRAGLVTSRRGPDGGYGLARPADQISVAEVVFAADQLEQGDPSGEAGPQGEAELPEDLQVVWRAVHASALGVLADVTVGDLAASRLPASVRELAGESRAVTRSGC